MGKFVLWAKKATHVGVLGLLSTFPIVMQGQASEGQNDGTQSPDIVPPVVNGGFKAVPILTGYTTYFTRVTRGQSQDTPTVYPLLLLPVGDKLITPLGPTGGVR